MSKIPSQDINNEYRNIFAEECIESLDQIVTADGNVQWALDDHQREAMEAVVYALADGRRRFSVVHPGGSGKTVLEAAIIQASQRAKQKLDNGLENTQDIVLAVERSLMGSVREHIAALGVDVGVWGHGEKTLDRPVVVTSIQALQTNKRNLHRLIDPTNIALVLGDEADKFLTEERQKILNIFANAQRIGFTATPEWPDGRHIEDAWGEIIHRVTLKEGIKSGINVPPLYTLFEADFNTDELEIEQEDFERKSLEAAMKAIEIELAIPQVYEAIVPANHRKEWPTMVFVPSVATVERVVETLQKTYPDLAITSWTGEIANGKLQSEIDDFNQGKIDILVLCEMGGRGLNLPRARAMIDAYPTLSPNKLEQRHARVLRKIRLGSRLHQLGVKKPFAHIAQIMPKSNTFRPRTFLDLMNCWDEYQPGKLLTFNPHGARGGEDGPPLQDEVSQIVENIKQHPLKCNVTMLETIDVLREIGLRENLPKADEEGFIYLDEEAGEDKK